LNELIGKRVMAAGQRLIVIFLGLLTIIAMLSTFSSGQAYPNCDNRVARAVLSKLYDNRRLLHAADVNGFRHLSDGLKGRYCTATVKWDNGLESQVQYQFYRSGRANQYIWMWIDYNGGMHGPSL
jgi:hypothetical protein